MTKTNDRSSERLGPSARGGPTSPHFDGNSAMIDHTGPQPACGNLADEEQFVTNTPPGLAVWLMATV